MIKLMGNYPGSSGWAQCHHKCFEDGEAAMSPGTKVSLETEKGEDTQILPWSLQKEYRPWVFVFVFFPTLNFLFCIGV